MEYVPWTRHKTRTTDLIDKLKYLFNKKCILEVAWCLIRNAFHVRTFSNINITCNMNIFAFDDIV